jgi:hypothetical protein
VEVALLMQLLFVVAHAGFHQHLRDLVFQLHVLADKKLAIA